MGFIDSIIDVQDLVSLPAEIKATFSPTNIRAKGYPFWTLRGDTTSFLMLFFDILATQMSGIGAMVYGVGFTPQFIYGHFMGGAGVSLFFGNILYALQASKVAMQTGNMKTCAQPYGINTPGMFVKTFAIMAPCLYAALADVGKGPFITGNWGDTSDATPAELETAMTITWNVACCANFIGGLVEFIGAFIAPMITRNVPEAAFLVPLAGIGATWLGYAPLAGIMASHTGHFPIVGFIPLVVTWLGFFASPDSGPLKGKFLYGNIPPVGMSCLFGVILLVIVNSKGYGAAFGPAVDMIGKGGVKFPDLGYFSSPYFATYSSIGTIVGLSFTNFIGTFGCNISARIGGDIYSPMEQMLTDGLGTMLGALCGSPLATTVYIGHPTYQKFGATRGYSVVNGTLWLIVGLAGMHALLDALIPHEILLGSLVCVGFVIVKQTYEASHPRWYPAVSIGICICFSDYIVNLMGLTPDKDVQVFAVGYVWTSCLWSFALMMLTDRWFGASAIIFFVLGTFSAIGVVHSSQPGFVYDAKGHHIGGVPGTTETFKYIVTYYLAAVVCLVHLGLQKMGKLLEPEPDDYRVRQKEFYSQRGKPMEKTTVEGGAEMASA